MANTLRGRPVLPDSRVAAVLRDLLWLTGAADAARLAGLLASSAPSQAFIWLAIKNVAMFWTPLLLLHRSRPRQAVQVLVAAACLFLAPFMLATGGLASSAVAVAAAMPLLAAYTIGLRAAMAVGIWLGAVFAAGHTLVALGHPFPALRPETDWARLVGVLSGAALAMVPWLRTIVWEREAEAEADSSASRLDALIHSVDGIVWEWSAGRFTFVSDQAERLLGYPCERWTENSLFFEACVLSDDRGIASAPFCEPQAARSRAYEFRMRTAGGQTLWIRNFVSAGAPRGEHSPVLRGLMVDITTRRLAEESLEQKENHLRAILDSAPECIKLLDKECRLQAINPAGLAMIDADSEAQVIGNKAAAILAPEYREPFEELHRRVFQGESGSLAYEMKGFRGSVRWMETRSVPLRNPQGQIVSALSITRDMTTSRALEQAIRRSHAHLAEASEIAHVGYIDNDHVLGRIRYSPETYRLFGLPMDPSDQRWMLRDGQTEALFQAIVEEDRERHRAAVSALRTAGKPFDHTYRVRHPNGEIRHIRNIGEAEFGPNGAVTRTFGVVKDVTEYQRAADRLRDLSAHVEQVREEERARIAREIHDELGQQLTGLKMRTAFAGHLSQGDERVSEELAAMESDLEQAIRTVRGIATELRPPVLDALGLKPALQWLGEKFERDHGIECHTDLDAPHVPRDTATAVFRVAQEGLTNVARHARATRVRLVLRVRTSDLVLEVEDDGVGIPNPDVAPSGTFGVTSMRERARLQRGQLALGPAPSGGLLLRFTLPLEASAMLAGPTESDAASPRETLPPFEGRSGPVPASEEIYAALSSRG